MASGGGSSGNSKISVIGEGIRLVASGQSASFLLSAPGFMPQDVDVSVSSPTKRPIHARVTEVIILFFIPIQKYINQYYAIE